MVKKSEKYQSRLVFNCTEEVVTCYNNEGFLMKLIPISFNPFPNYEYGIVYIVEDGMYNQLKLTGRQTDDLVHVVGDSQDEVGRGGVKFSYLKSYEEKPCDGIEHVIISPCSEYSYHKNDPNSKIHQLLNV